MGGRRKSLSTFGGRKQKSSERLSVYDFDFDPLDSRVEKEAAKILNKFSDLNNEQFSHLPPSNRRHTRRRGSSSSPVNKYDFLRCFAGAENVVERKEDEEEKKRIEPIVVDDDDENATPMEVDSGCSSRAIALSPPPPPAVLKEGSWVDLDTVVLSSSSNCKKKEEGSLILDDGNDEDAVEVIETSSWSTSVSNCAENERKVSPGEEVVESGPIRHAIDDLNNKVVVFPDLFQCGNAYFTESRLTFTATSIRVEGLTLNGSLRTFSADCSIHDILSIELEWCGRVETATIDIHLKSEVYDEAGKAYKTSASKILHFSVCDPHWFGAQKAIKSLNVRYGDIWNVALQEIDKNAFLGFNSLVIPDPSYAVFDDSFKDVIYPKGDPDAVSISKRDMKLLQPDSFINDTIIDFYIIYLRKKVYPKDQHRFHFFNCFFFRKLADLDKDPPSACEGRAAFHRVRKWTRKINLFEKDYIFIPVNYSLHWSLIVICHPGEVAHFKDALADDESEKSLKVPCILHMDSIRGSHRGLKNLFQSYLWEEWKARCNNRVDHVYSKFLNLQFVSLELPQQENYFDCGLFLLHYLELFLEQAPVNFSPFRITENSNFLKRNWFLPLEASIKRQQIQKLIGEISEVEYQKVILGEHSIKRLSSQSHIADEQTSAPEVLKEGCRSPKASTGYLCSPNTSPKFISEASPCGVVEQRQILDLELGFIESFEPGSAVRSFPSGQKGERRQKNFLSPIKEDGGTAEQISDSSSDDEDSKKIAAEATEYPATSSFGENCRSWECRHIPIEELSKDSSTSGTSNCVVEDSEDSDSSSIYMVDTDSPALHGNSKGYELPSTEDLDEENNNILMSKVDLMNESDELPEKKPGLFVRNGR